MDFSFFKKIEFFKFFENKQGDGSVQGFTDQSIASGMPLDRFTLLMSKAISNQIEESWICLKAQKIAIYSVQYMPWLHRKLMKGLKIMCF